VAAALPSIIGSIVGLLALNRIYGEGTTSLADSARTQYLAGLGIVSPSLAVRAP
jgi:hypothetical protein